MHVVSIIFFIISIWCFFAGIFFNLLGNKRRFQYLNTPSQYQNLIDEREITRSNEELKISYFLIGCASCAFLLLIAGLILFS